MNRALASRILCAVCFAATIPSTSQAVDEKKSDVGTFVAPANKNSLKITLKASRDQAVAGSSFGISAEIENISDKPVYVTPSSFVMTAPPELDSDGPRDWWAFFPGLTASPGQTLWDTVTVIEPGSNIEAFWSGNLRPLPKSTDPYNESLLFSLCPRVGINCRDFIRGLSFTPGKYTLTIVGSYWDTYEGAQAKSIERHTQTAELQETITAPQSAILFGAAIGGIIAFFLVTRGPTDSKSLRQMLRGTLPGLVTSVLLSVIVTILLSRLSESQFIIRVTVNDLWGAVAVGFVIAATGPSILQKFTALVSSGTKTPPQISTPPEAPPVSVTPADSFATVEKNGHANESSPKSTQPMDKQEQAAAPTTLSPDSSSDSAPQIELSNTSQDGKSAETVPRSIPADGSDNGNG